MQRFFEEYLIMKDDVEQFMEHFEGRIEGARNKKKKEKTIMSKDKKQIKRIKSELAFQLINQ